MLMGQGFSQFLTTFDNYDANPVSTLGTSIVPGTSNAEGAWTQFTGITEDVYWVSLIIHTGSTSAQIKSHLVDIGVDPAGGTSYTVMVSNLSAGGSPSINAGGTAFLFPLFIRAGSSMGIRVQGGNATPGTVRVAYKLWAQPSRPEMVPVASFSETIGSISGSNGNSFTPGNASDGTWASLGTTTQPLWWWQLGYHIANATVTAEYTYIDLAFGDASNKHIIKRMLHNGAAAEWMADYLKGK